MKDSHSIHSFSKTFIHSCRFICNETIDDDDDDEAGKRFEWQGYRDGTNTERIVIEVRLGSVISRAWEETDVAKEGELRNQTRRNANAHSRKGRDR